MQLIVIIHKFDEVRNGLYYIFSGKYSEVSAFSQ